MITGMLHRRDLVAPCRPVVRGKFIYLGSSKLFVRGVTYGTFAPMNGHGQFPEPATVARDFTAMARVGINAVRTYTMPPLWLLDLAHQHGLLVMAGIPWEQHITFLDDAQRCASIEATLRDAVNACAGHPALLCYTIGNEIPMSIVRWHGKKRIEQFLHRLYCIAKDADPQGLVTYVSFPTTEYLELPFLDFIAFNVYLETRERLDSYLARLQTIAGDRPLVMAEIGLDSRRNGEATQAETLHWQVSTAFAAGCAGAFVFAWTDEWYRGGYDIDDWDFGLTRRDRTAKPALWAVGEAFRHVPFGADVRWPRISVVVCSYNGSRTIRECLQGISELDYDNYEVIVVDDGSRDTTPDIAREFPFRLISTENFGLSSARNTGWQNATGEIIAYIDDDAYPDPHWLQHLAWSYMNSDHMGMGGPNIPPPGDGMVAACVANSPGGPIHVLLSDRLAEHVPGCNMSFRRSALAAIGGFDTRFRIAGDDVDLCWRIQQQGWTIGFSPAAMVWHHRRNQVKIYLKQQRNYGRAEAMLEEKWPDKYNAAGHASWSGRMYGPAHRQI
ncbi:MAG: glycosyltransferase, partial [bacterium]|nr:glycosyltransferase [Candidatus Kapabacteria bacterium]